MSAFNMKPKFNDYQSYMEWKKTWKSLYVEISANIRRLKLETKAIQRSGSSEEAGAMQKKLAEERVMGAKAMSLLVDAQVRWSQIKDMRASIAAQHATFPLVVENVRNMDFHFNKKHLEFPDVVPMWILKAKGSTYYLHHIDCETPWTTREQPDNPSTKGAIRIKRGNISIDANASAVIS